MQNSPQKTFTTCPKCLGIGKKKQRLKKSVRLAFQRAVQEFEKSNTLGAEPISPKAHLSVCKNCAGSGLISTEKETAPNTENYPNLAIIGGGIGGVALAVACLHRGIPFTLYERDTRFAERLQGYGLTLQQASKAMEGFGLFSLEQGVVSTRHIVYTTDGKVVGEWGMRKWLQTNDKKATKRSNIHIARQSLRLALLKQLGDSKKIKWGHQLVDLKETADGTELKFQTNGKTIKEKADLVIGADGIRSTVRKLLIGEEATPLRYLDCIVILGICPIDAIDVTNRTLLDSETVFQTANGNERIYIMPYDSKSVMWQLSFPMSEKNAKELSSRGQKALKEEACKRTNWHAPIPQILEATHESLISGYPVYDRELLRAELLVKGKYCTLIGDAAHPMSPFKGQGANQALLDALALARGITKGCRPQSNWQKEGIRKSVLTDFESKMLERSAVKVIDSAEAAQFLHSDLVLHESNEPRRKFSNL